MKRLKRAVVVLLAVVLAAGAMLMPATAEAATGEMTDFDNIDNSSFDQNYVEIKKISTGKTGQKMTVSFTLVNAGKDLMENVKIRLVKENEYKNIFDVEEDEEEEGNSNTYIYPFEYTSDVEKIKDDIKKLSPGEKRSVSMGFKVKRNLKEGYYPVVFQIEDDNSGRTLVGVNVWISTSTGSTEEDDNNKIDYDFTIGENQATPYAAYSNVMNFGVNLRNSGLKKVYDVRVYMQLDPDTAKFPFDINDGNYDRLMGDMEPDQTVSVPYSMAVREDVKSGFYPITYKITYREEMGGDFVEPISKSFYVRVKGKDDDELAPDASESDRTKARIIVESFSTDPEEVYAGNVFTLRVRMKNASSDVKATNIMFTFASEEVNSSPVFTTSSGSTSLVVNQLAPGETTDLQLQFESSPTAEQKSYVMTIKEKYDSPEFKNAAEEVKISIPVKQMPRLNTGTIEVMPDSINVGSESNVMFGINNTGKVLLYNVSAKFEGASIQTTDSYVGNIKPGETGNVDAMISGIAPTADDGKVKIIISYEDENGETTEIEKEMTLFVSEAVNEMPGDMEAGMMGEGGMMGDPEAEPSLINRFKIPVILAVIAIAVAATAIKLKKKKKAAEEEEMDDEIS